MDPRETATILQHFGDQDILGAIAPPIFQASNFSFGSPEEWMAMYHQNPSGPPYQYSRLGNPTVSLLEEKLAKLERTEACKVTGCGQGAIATAIMACTAAGSHVVCVDTAYGPVRELLDGILKRFGVETTFVSGLDAEELIDSIRPETSLVYLESPSSLVMRLQDLRKVTAVCQERGITTALDNTYASPIYQQPHTMGVDIILHSASKYFGGHSDINGGVICAGKPWIDALTKSEINLLGTIQAPFPAWLTLRGLRTLELRIKRHEASANQIASWIAGLPRIERVNHVSLPGFDQRQLYLSQMQGSTGLFSFEPECQDPVKIKKFVASLQFFRQAVSWGGFESLALALHTRPIGYPSHKWLVRLFIGLEDPNELQEDLQRAFDESELLA